MMSVNSMFYSMIRNFEQCRLRAHSPFNHQFSLAEFSSWFYLQLFATKTPHTSDQITITTVILKNKTGQSQGYDSEHLSEEKKLYENTVNPEN